MTNQEKIAYLQQYRALDRQIDRALEEQARLRARAERMTPVMSAAPGGGGEDRIQAAVERIVELERQIDANVDRLVELRGEIERAVAALPDARYQEVLQRRYLDGDTFERIAVKMHYSYQWVCVLHGQALDYLIIVDSN